MERGSESGLGIFDVAKRFWANKNLQSISRLVGSS